MKATVAWAPLVTMLVQHVPDQVVACAGEESTEAAYQARRQSVNVSSQKLPLWLVQHCLHLVQAVVTTTLRWCALSAGCKQLTLTDT